MSALPREDIEARYDRIEEMIRAGMTVTVIADKLGVTKRTVQRGIRARGLVRRQSTPWTAEEMTFAKALLEDGAPIKEVARTLGRSERSISNKFVNCSKVTSADGPKIRVMMQELEKL